LSLVDKVDKVDKDSAPTADDYSRYKTSDVPSDIETKIPVIEERLNVQKRESSQEATITKEPMTEKKTVVVPVTRVGCLLNNRI
jgi:stress response protein YsnF